MILVFGKTGQVACELQKVNCAESLWFLSRDQVDLCNTESIVAAINEVKPIAVINAAAFTAVDAAEQQISEAIAINGIAPGTMAKACHKLGIPLVHISTDYVFDGVGDLPFSPDDTTGPAGIYGQSKLAGEEAIQESGATYVIIRTSWVFSAHGNNFVKTMLRIANNHDKVSVVSDQIGAPTSASAIAEACVSIAMQLCKSPSKSGIYHYCGYPNISWAGFATEVFERANTGTKVAKISTAEYPTSANRPANSRLDCSSTAAIFGIKQQSWRDALELVIQQLK